MATDAQAVYWFTPSAEIDVNFSLLDANVESTVNVPGPPESNEHASHGYILIQVRVTVEDFDSAGEAARYARPLLLVVLGVLSYLTGHHFSVYAAISQHHSKAPYLQSPKPIASRQGTPRLICEGEDRSADLKRLLDVIANGSEHERSMLYSLLDRWRRAQFLLQESEAGLHHEDAFLAFFHILELLTTRFYPEQRTQAEASVRTFVTDLMVSVFKLRGDRLQQAINERMRTVQDILLEKDFSIATKILYMLDRLGLLEPKTHALVDAFVKTRNEIAHGRLTFRSGMIWPVPPFFSILSQHSFATEQIEVFTAQVLGRFYGIDRWTSEWTAILGELDPPLDIVRSLVREGKVLTLSRVDFEAGKVQGVRPASVVNAYLAGKLSFELLEKTLKAYVLGTTAKEKPSPEAALALVLLSDSIDSLVAEHCRKEVPLLSPEDFGVTNVKDVLRELEDRGLTVVWFRSHLDSIK